MDPDQEKALLASIERKMGNVLQSVHSRNSVSSGDTSSLRKSQRSTMDLISPTTPGGATSSDTSDTATLPEKPKHELGQAILQNMALSVDDFEETFSDASDSANLDPGLPVDSLANFIAPVGVQRKGSARKKERGHITENGATEDEDATPIRTKSRERASGTNKPSMPQQTKSFAGRFIKKVTLGIRSAANAPKSSKRGPADEN